MNKQRQQSTTGITSGITSKTTARIAALLMVLIMAFSFAACGNGEGQNGEVQNADGQKGNHTEQAAQSADNELKATLLVASDYQEEEGWNSPGENLTGIIRAATKDGKKIDEVIICGDYSNDRNLHDYQIDPEPALEEIRTIVEAECPEIKAENDESTSESAESTESAESNESAESILFVQGNHDHMNDSIAESGLHEFDDYLVYVLNTEEDFPWKQGKVSGSMDKVKNTAEEMKACFDKLIKAGETRPVIIAGHVPLHFSGRTSSLHTTGDNLYSSILFDVINEAGKSLDITFLFGHNHTKGWDCYLGMSCVFKTKGDTILIPEFSENDLTSNTCNAEKLNFIYLNAGYLGHCMNCSPDEVESGTVDQYKAADNTLTATVCEIYGDRIVFTRYAEDGVHQLSSEGCANPYRNDSSMISQQYYSKQLDSPKAINRNK